MTKAPLESDMLLWRRVVATHGSPLVVGRSQEDLNAYFIAKKKFLDEAVGRSDVLKQFLGEKYPPELISTENMIAVSLLRDLHEDELIELLPEIIFQFSGMPIQRIEDIRQPLLSLPRELLILHIEEAAELTLQKADDWAYSTLLAFYRKIDQSLYLRLAMRAAQHDDTDIRDIGQNALDELNEIAG